MASEITLTLDQGFSTTFEGRTITIAQARWDLSLVEHENRELLQRALLAIVMEPAQAAAFGERFAPVARALAQGHSRYRLELAPDVREIVNAASDRVLPAQDWLSVADSALMRLESYIYLAALRDPSEADSTAV